MSDRKEVLKPFAAKQSYMDDRIQSGIEANRKGCAAIRFQDKDGKPVENARVKIRQKNHDFRIGANLFMLEEFNSAEQNAAYRELFADVFNIATLPFYWRDLEPEPGKPRFAADSPKLYRRPAPDLCLDYCEKYGIEPKAHCLNYASFAPEWATRDVAMEKRLLAKRFRELAERYAMRIPSWEVTNETFWGARALEFFPFYHEPDFVEWSFDTAKTYFPGNRLVINEAHCRIWNDEYFYRTRSPYYMQIERAMQKGARIDSIGMQYHMFMRREKEIAETAQFYDPERIYEVLDTYATLGKPIQITELTIPAYSYAPEDEELQAEILRNIYSMWFSHPAMEAIIYWNLVDGFAAFAPQGDMNAGENYYHGGLVRYDFTPKPSYRMMKELFGKTWRTNLDRTASGDTLQFKGFYGAYELEIAAGGQTVKREIHLYKNQPNRYTVTL